MDLFNRVIQPLCVSSLVVFMVIFGIGMAYLYYKTQRDASQFPIHYKKAIPATAKVLEIGDSVTSRYGGLHVALRLEVTPPEGAIYQVISLWYVKHANLNNIQPGKSLPIKIDCDNQKVIYPAESLTWARQDWIYEFGEDRFHREISMPDQRTQKRFDQAVPAVATVVQKGRSHVSKGSTTSVALRLEVAPPQGPAYQVVSVWEVQPVHIADVHVGKSLRVRIDRENPQVIFSGEPWAVQSDAHPYIEADMTN